MDPIQPALEGIDAPEAPAEGFTVGPCESTFNQMMAEIQAQARRASLIAPVNG